MELMTLENVEPDDREVMTEAIKSLPYREQLTLSLMFEKGMSLFECGVVMELPPRKILTIYSHAIVHLNYELLGWREQRCQSCGAKG